MDAARVNFSTPGLIDITAAVTFGVNVKETDNPIGYFGTGMKYAIAVILRNGGRIELIRGRERYSFETYLQAVRGKEFGIVHLRHPNGTVQPLGFTTELGKTWEPWMALRELYCNTKDEGGSMTHLEMPVLDNHTLITVSNFPAFCKAYEQRRDFFLDDDGPVITENHILEIRPGPTKSVFFKGIRVHDLTSNAMFVYNFTDKNSVTLTEDRTIKNTFMAIYCHIPTAIITSSDRELIERVVTAENGTFEGSMDYDAAGRPGDTFMSVVADLYYHQRKSINENALKKYKRHVTLPPPKEVELDTLDRVRFQRAKDFCNRLGYPVHEYPILVVDTLGEGVLAEAIREGNYRILLTKQLFTQGTKLVAQALIEEWIHLKHGFDDETRAMQTFLFEQITSLGERLLEDPL